MNNQKLAMVMVSVFCLTVSLARAQDDEYPPEGAGPYFRAAVGPTFFQDGTLREFSLQGSAPFSPQNQTVRYNVGGSADFAIGYAFDKYFGLDFQSGYVWGSINNVSGYYANGSTIGNVPLLVNGTFSLPISNTGIVPYIGAGVGGSVSEFDAHGFGNATGSSYQTAYGSESDAVFAYQAFAGVRFMLNPNLSLGVGYKYFATGDSTFSYPPSPNLNIGFSGVRTHSILFTLQYNF